MAECVMNCRFLKNEFIKNFVKNELPYTLDSAMPLLWPFLTMKTTGSLVGSCDRLISADIGTLNKVCSDIQFLNGPNMSVHTASGSCIPKLL